MKTFNINNQTFTLEFKQGPIGAATIVRNQDSGEFTQTLVSENIEKGGYYTKTFGIVNGQTFNSGIKEDTLSRDEALQFAKDQYDRLEKRLTESVTGDIFDR